MSWLIVALMLVPILWIITRSREQVRMFIPVRVKPSRTRMNKRR